LNFSTRILLASNDIAGAGIGNEHDNVGRYFQGIGVAQAASNKYSGGKTAWPLELKRTNLACL
jgi:hypothetical protein